MSAEVKLPREAPFEPSRVAGISRAAEKSLKFLGPNLPRQHLLLHTAQACFTRCSFLSHTTPFDAPASTESDPAISRTPCQATAELELRYRLSVLRL